MLDRPLTSIARRAWALLLLAALVPACKKESAPHVPVLSGLTWSPASAPQNSGGGSVFVAFSVDVADAGADITALAMTLRDPAGTQLDSVDVPLENPAGLTSGTLGGTAPVPTTALGTYVLTLRVRDSTGAQSNAVEATVAVTEPPPAPVVTSLSPSSAEAGTNSLTLTVTGSGFDAASYVTWNGSWVSTTFVDSTTLQAVLSPYQLGATGTAQVGVYSYSGGTSNTLAFTVTPAMPRPAPVLTGLSPASVDAGSGDLTLTVTGSDFHPSSTVTFGGTYTSYFQTTFVSSTELRATITAYYLQAPGTYPVTVITPSPGGGQSAALTFTVKVPSIPGATVLALPGARDMVFDPYEQKLYLALASTAPTAPNAIAVLDPVTGELLGSVDGGSEPGPLALSDDGQFLYVGHGGSSDVTRFTLPGLVADLSIPLGRDASAGPYLATGLSAAPGAPDTVAVALTAGYATATAVFDGATARAGRAAGSAALCWGADAGTLYAAGPYSGDLSAYPVSASGLGTATLYRSAFATGAQLQFDAGTGLLYAADGRAVDPATGGLDGTYAVGYSAYSAAMVPDSSLGTAFFAYAQDYAGWLGLHPFDLARYVPGTPTALPYVAGPALRLVRFGPDGLALLTSTRLVLLRGAAVLPAAASANPAPTLTSLSPATVPAGAGNLRLRVEGTGYVPGTVVRVGGVERFTRRLDATRLEVHVPRSAMTSAASLEVTATSPAPGGGTSAAMTLTVGP
ncbi:MAG: IPT/TIG domain-containing protein [Deltaproteobacteria bacterium]|nr:IPT/TIG domain-containing protein [Deltaproteobacteria bacterium]